MLSKIPRDVEFLATLSLTDIRNYGWPIYHWRLLQENCILLQFDLFGSIFLPKYDLQSNHPLLMSFLWGNILDSLISFLFENCFFLVSCSFLKSKYFSFFCFWTYMSCSAFDCLRNNMILLRSSRPEVFVKKGVLTNFAKFAVKHLFQSLFFNKVAGLRLATLLKKKL